MAELADAHGSGPCTRKGVGVRVPSMAPRFLLLPKSFTALPISPVFADPQTHARKEAQVDVESMRFRDDARELPRSA